MYIVWFNNRGGDDLFYGPFANESEAQEYIKKNYDWVDSDDDEIIVTVQEVFKP